MIIREGKTNITTQVDIAKYADWLANNPHVKAKFPATGEKWLSDDSFCRGQSPIEWLPARCSPDEWNCASKKRGAGILVATPNPLYVWGSYNCTNPAFLGTTNTSSGSTVPCALMSDALTILSSARSDYTSMSSGYSRRGTPPTALSMRRY